MNLKKVIINIFLIIGIFGMQVTDAANIKEYPRVAVMNFGNKAITSKGLRSHDFSSATEYAIYQLSACGWFDLIDYEQLSTIANIHSVNMSELVDPMTAVQVGKFAGAQFMVVGNVTGLTTKENGLDFQYGNKGGFGNAQHVVTANVSLRIVDIETGRIVCAGLGTGSSTSTNTELYFRKYRNRKIETEDISNTITRDIINEYTRNDKYDKKESYSMDKDLIKKNDKSRTEKDNSTTNIEESKSNIITEEWSKENRDESTETESSERSSLTTEEESILKEMTAHSKGDVNDDGVIDEIDLEILNSKMVGLPVDDNYNPYNADVNSDGVINVNDVSLLKLHLSGKKLLPTAFGTLTPVSSEGKFIKSNGETQTEENSKKQETIEQWNKNAVDSQENNKKTTMVKDVEVNESNSIEDAERISETKESSNSTDATVNKANNTNYTTTTNKSIYYERETEDYRITIGTVEVSDIQVRNAISKAVRDAIYGDMGIMTTLNNGKKLKIKTGF